MKKKRFPRVAQLSHHLVRPWNCFQRFSSPFRLPCLSCSAYKIILLTINLFFASSYFSYVLPTTDFVAKISYNLTILNSSITYLSHSSIRVFLLFFQFYSTFHYFASYFYFISLVILNTFYHFFSQCSSFLTLNGRGDHTLNLFL